MPDNLIHTSNPAAILSEFIKQKRYSKVAVLADDNTSTHCYDLLKGIPAHEVITISAGEEYKTIETCQTIWEALTQYHFDRHSLLIVLGGGVLGDMGGFCAATFKRGIDFALVPTTLLSQVDASIGGKLGIDFKHFKNHIGVFRHPAITVLCSKFLHTLSIKEKRSGFAEIIKHCLISDAAMWQQLRKANFENQDLDTLIRHSVDFKQKIVSEDPREKGLRKILNFGHTIGHAVETFLLNSGSKILHGEAIAVGMIAESYLSWQRGLLTEKAFTEIKDYLLGLFGKVEIDQRFDEQIATLTLQDKKNEGDKILCVLLDGIGKAKWDCQISKEEVKRALAIYRSL